MAKRAPTFRRASTHRPVLRRVALGAAGLLLVGDLVLVSVGLAQAQVEDHIVAGWEWDQEVLIFDAAVKDRNAAVTALIASTTTWDATRAEAEAFLPSALSVLADPVGGAALQTQLKNASTLLKPVDDVTVFTEDATVDEPQRGASESDEDFANDLRADAAAIVDSTSDVRRDASRVRKASKDTTGFVSSVNAGMRDVLTTVLTVNGPALIELVRPLSSAQTDALGSQLTALQASYDSGTGYSAALAAYVAEATRAAALVNEEAESDSDSGSSADTDVDSANESSNTGGSGEENPPADSDEDPITPGPTPTPTTVPTPVPTQGPVVPPPSSEDQTGTTQ